MPGGAVPNIPAGALGAGRGFAEVIRENPEIISVVLGGLTGGPAGALAPIILGQLGRRERRKPQPAERNGEDFSLRLQKIFEEQQQRELEPREEIFANRPLTLSELARQAGPTRPTGQLTLGSLGRLR